MKQHNLSVAGFARLQAMDFTGQESGLDAQEAIAKITGTSNPTKPTEFAAKKQAIVSQAVEAADPTYLVKYKGIIFGYYPAEIKTLEACAAIEVFSKNKKWSMIAALLFRPVQPLTRFAHWNKNKWESKYGIKVKTIDKFKHDMLKYTCKDVDFAEVDLEFWDDFPWPLVQGNLNFLIGSGLKLSLSIQPSSLRVPMIQKELINMTDHFQEVLIYMTLLTVLRQVMYLTYTDNDELSILLQEKYSAFSQLNSNEKSLLEKVELDAYVASGGTHKHIIAGFKQLYQTILDDSNLAIDSCIGICGIMKANTFNNKYGWLIKT